MKMESRLMTFLRVVDVSGDSPVTPTNEANLEFVKRTVSEIQRLENQYSIKPYQLGREIEDVKLYQAGKEFPWNHGNSFSRYA